MVNIYASNYDDEAFVKCMFLILPDMSSHRLILGGDFNCWLNPHLDCSSAKVCSPSKSAKVIQSFMQEFAVSDVWCFFNPSKREHYFFPLMYIILTPHLGIDFFLINNRFLRV